jgi:hypothetical protein
MAGFAINVETLQSFKPIAGRITTSALDIFKNLRAVVDSSGTNVSTGGITEQSRNLERTYNGPVLDSYQALVAGISQAISNKEAFEAVAKGIGPVNLNTVTDAQVTKKIKSFSV